MKRFTPSTPVRRSALPASAAAVVAHTGKAQCPTAPFDVYLMTIWTLLQWSQAMRMNHGGTAANGSGHRRQARR